MKDFGRAHDIMAVLMGRDFRHLCCYKDTALELQLPLPTPSPTNILPKPIPSNLLPLDFLPRNRQLPPQALERPLAQRRKAPIQLFLVLFLCECDLSYHLGRGRGGDRECQGFGRR